MWAVQLHKDKKNKIQNHLPCRKICKELALFKLTVLTCLGLGLQNLGTESTVRLVIMTRDTGLSLTKTLPTDTTTRTKDQHHITCMLSYVRTVRMHTLCILCNISKERNLQVLSVLTKI